MKYLNGFIGAGFLSLFVGSCYAQDPVPAADTPPPTEAAPASLNLGDYKLVLGPKVLNVKENSSGLAYHAPSKTLYMVINGPCQLVQMDLTGEIKRTIGLAGFDDTEAVAWMGGKKFVVAEEKRRRIATFELDDKATSVAYTKSNFYNIEKAAPDNVGYEGVAYDKANKRFFIVKEKDPRKILITAVPPTKGAPKYVKEAWDIQAEAMGMGDLSDIHFDPETQHLFILSDEDKCLVETTVDGKEISRLSLKHGNAGLAETIPQPEGVTVDTDGNVYICSEPNIFYVFAPAK